MKSTVKKSKAECAAQSRQTLEGLNQDRSDPRDWRMQLEVNEDIKKQFAYFYMRTVIINY